MIRQRVMRKRLVAVTFGTLALGLLGVIVWIDTHDVPRDPDAARGHIVGGRRLAQAGRTADALVELQAAARADPTSPSPHLVAAGVLIETGHATGQ